MSLRDTMIDPALFPHISLDEQVVRAGMMLDRYVPIKNSSCLGDIKSGRFIFPVTSPEAVARHDDWSDEIRDACSIVNGD